MAHIQIGPDGMTVDGVQVPVLADTFSVDFQTLPHATVRCTIPADAIEIDLPEAVLDVERERARDVVGELRLIRSLLNTLTFTLEAERDRTAKETGTSERRR